MSLQEITTKIKADAEAEAKSLWAEADERLSAVAKATKAQIEEIHQESKVALDKEKAHRQAVILSLEKQRISLAKQKVKRQLLDKVYDEAFNQLLTIPATEYISLVENKIKEIVSKDTEIVSVLAPENRKSETEAIIKSFGWTATITTDKNLKGGCILVGKNFEFDLSWERLFAEDRSLSETEVANILFSAHK